MDGTEPLDLVLGSPDAVTWRFAGGATTMALGGMEVHGEPVAPPVTEGLFWLYHEASGRRVWLTGSDVEHRGSDRAVVSGEADVDRVRCAYRIDVAIDAGNRAAKLVASWRVDGDLPGWQACFAYQSGFRHPWSCHLYPFAAGSKFVSESPLTYVGVPSTLLYRDDFSIALLFGIDPSSDYLNPTTWTGDTGFFFMDGVWVPQLRLGGAGLVPGIDYELPMHLIASTAGESMAAVTELVEAWIMLTGFEPESLFVRSPSEALELFLQGRRRTTMWQPGIGYQLEEGDPDSDFVYLGEQPLSAYFEYLIYEMTGDDLWRRRCFEQMDWVLRGQNLSRDHIHYGAIHTAFDLRTREFDSDDRGANVGYKPDLNAYMARYMLQVWERVRAAEGLDRQDWYEAAVRAADWVLRQRNPDGGLPQKVSLEGDHRSISVVSGRALPAMPIIADITGDDRYRAFAGSLERFVRSVAEARLVFVGHHPDLPPDEIEEASIWGVIEYWLDMFERTGDREYLDRAVGDAHLSLLWWCPKQLSWVANPTQCASAEQQHFLQYSIYCYQNRKLQCLHRLHTHTGMPIFRGLFDRVLQGIFWTQVTEGDLMGATHERICDPWLARDDHEDEPEFNSLGTIYMGEQSLDAMLQLIEMGEATVGTRTRSDHVPGDGIHGIHGGEAPSVEV